MCTIKSTPIYAFGVSIALLASLFVIAAPAGATVTAANFSYTVAPGGTLSVGAPGLLAGAQDTDGGSPIAEYQSFPNHGLLDLSESGSFSFTADKSYVGGDSFTYQVCDNNTFNCATGIVNLTITAAAPTAMNQNYTVRPGVTLSLAAPGMLTGATAPNGDSLTATIVSEPNEGILTPNEDGAFNFSANAGFVGNDSFLYQACDSVTGLCSSNATVSVSITAPAPTAVAHAYVVRPGGALTIAVPGLLLRATAPSGDNLTASSLTYPSHGFLDVNQDGAFTYSVDALGNFVGKDSFTYQVCDSTTQLCSTGTIASITIGVAPRLSIPSTVRVVSGRTISRLFKLTGNPAPKWTVSGRLPRGLRLVKSGKTHVELVGKPTAAGKAHIKIALSSAIFPRVVHDVTVVVSK